MSFDIAQLRREVAQHGRVCRIVIVDAKGSVPRDAGVEMRVWADGQSGTIGGGVLEYEATQDARALLAAEQSRALRKQPLGPALGQCCGGAVTVLWEVFDAQTLPDFAASDTAYMRKIAAYAVSAPPTTMTNAINRGLHHTISADGWLAEPLTSAPTPVWIYGAGHVGRAVAATLSPLPDTAVTLIDTQADRFPDPLPDGVTPAISARPADIAHHAPQTAHHLIMTYSHTFDLELCHALLGHHFASVGLIGSATKWARFQSRLRGLGHTQDQINRITCPIGEPDLGKHPQEIAIGVARSLLLDRADTTARSEIAS